VKKIRRNDEVVVIAGKDKGKRGKVLSVRADNRVVVEGINMVKRHTRPNPMKNEKGGIVEREGPIQISNVAVWNLESEKADRVGFAIDEDGDKRRVYKSNRKPVDV